MIGLQEKIENLFAEQLSQWDLLKANHAAFAHIYRRSIDMGKGVLFEIQFNPLRKGSSLAKTDAKSIADRPCFLCAAHRPLKQKEVAFAAKSGNNYSILCNPYPIFPKHFTIVENQHVIQSFENRLSDMIELTEKLTDYVIFFNGAQCGASAPDHFHFQAGNKGFMPFEQLFSTILKNKTISSDKDSIRSLDFPGHPYLLTASTSEDIIKLVNELWLQLAQIEKAEPSINILMWKNEKMFQVGLFHRKSHRPRCFFAEDESNRMISPGSVDMGGVIVCALEKDFNILSASEIRTIFNEITFE